MRIEDRPRFPWRGLMLDVSRHWMPLAVVERNLDAMAAVKLNVFHWHLSDDQGFRVESKRFPKLQEIGPTAISIRRIRCAHIMEYARERGIRVVPEFDIPGHTQSGSAGYPELASTPGTYTIGRTWGIYYPVMDPTREETYQFLDGFIGEMAALFPDPYFHIGGDEVNPKEWKAERADHAVRQGPQPQRPGSDCRRTSTSAFRRSWRRTGRSWWAGTRCCTRICPTTTVIQSWRGQRGAGERGEARASRTSLVGLLSRSPASGAATITRWIRWAVAAAQLPPDAAARILGGEACMWVEYADAETVDSRIWPRAGRDRGALLVAEGDERTSIPCMRGWRW